MRTYTDTSRTFGPTRAADRACLDMVRTGDRRVIELIDDAVASALGEALDGVALAFLAVLVRADVGRR